MWNFFDERSSDEDALDQVAAARGFCSHHAEQLRRIEVDGLKSTIAISDVHEHTLRTLAAENAGFRERFRGSPGLCVAHFQLTWDASRTSEERALLRDTELDAVRSLLAELHEHLRKQRAEHSHELPGTEADSWQRAVWLTGGWPAPAASAGIPES